MAMREAAFLITLILIIGSLPPLTAGKGVEKPVQRDVFLYDYFSEVLVHFEYSLKYTLANESYGLKLATQTLNELELINTEAMYYRDRGVDSPVMEVIPPLLRLRQGARYIGQHDPRIPEEAHPPCSGGRDNRHH